MHFNWRWRTAHRTGAFLLRDALTRRLDRMLGRRPREEALLDFVRDRAPRGEPGAVLAAMDDFARHRRWLMNVGPVKGRILREALAGTQAARVLEIGAYCGYSATLICEQLAARSGVLVSIERSRRFSAVARAIVAHAGLADRLDLRTGTLASEIGTLSGPFDLVFLDHWKDEYLPDLERLEQASLLRPGTVVVADNIDFFAVPEYLEHVRNGGRYDSRFAEASVEYRESLRDGVEVSVYRGPPKTASRFSTNARTPSA
jgi:catechol O-methyltransferase